MLSDSRFNEYFPFNLLIGLGFFSCLEEIGAVSGGSFPQPAKETFIMALGQIAINDRQ